MFFVNRLYIKGGEYWERSWMSGSVPKWDLLDPVPSDYGTVDDGLSFK